MNVAAACACLSALALAGCALAPRAGPLAGEVKAQARAGRAVLYDVVKVDDRVVHTLLARQHDSFADRFKKFDEPAEPRMAVGDTVAVLIWEAGSGGLFSPAAPELSAAAPRSTRQPRREEAPPKPAAPRRPAGLDQLLELPAQPPKRAPAGERQSEQDERQGEHPVEAPSLGVPGAASFSAFETASDAVVRQDRGVRIPDQRVGSDGGLTVPYAGRIPAAGRTPAEVQRAIERRLAGKALSPQALVLVERSPANSVTVSAESEGARRVPLAAGERLLQVIAAAGGSGFKVHQTFVRLSRGGVTATIPYARLVADPAEDIYAQPGDVLTLVRIPQTFSVFGAAGRNAAITFDAPGLTLAEALAKSHGLRNDLANPAGVFVLRYEPDRIVRALHQPIATAAPPGVSPVVYRFNFRNAASYLAAQRFPVHDKDIIFVADADIEPLQRVLDALSGVTGPVYGALATCVGANC